MVTEAKLLERVAVLEAEVERAYEVMRMLLERVGDPGQCSGCNVPIYWVRYKGGRVGPHNLDGVSHFATCPKADQFRRH